MHYENRPNIDSIIKIYSFNTGELVKEVQFIGFTEYIYFSNLLTNAMMNNILVHIAIKDFG
jgi:hypothetical protein